MSGGLGLNLGLWCVSAAVAFRHSGSLLGIENSFGKGFRKEKLMRQRSFRVLVSLCFLLLLALKAQGQVYQRPTPTADGGPPTSSDLAVQAGAARILTVQLLNLTPYDIQFVDNPGVAWSITSANETAMQDTYRWTAKSFMFVPAAIPSLIPGAPAQDFVPEYIKNEQGNWVSNPAYDPNYKDTTTHPYPMVFAWDDHNGFVVDNWAKWTIKGVKFSWCDDSGPKPVCEYRYQNVDLGLWMYRNKPTFKLSSSLLPLLTRALTATVETLALVVEFENPMAWLHEFLAIKETAVTAAEFAKENTQENDGEEMWVASYLVPNPTSSCVRGQAEGYVCDPMQMLLGDTGDGVYTQWTATMGGPCDQIASNRWQCSNYAAEQQLIVSVHMLRGHKAKQCDPNLYPKVCPLGSEPLVMITVMREEDFDPTALAALAPLTGENPTGEDAANKIRRFLLQAGAGRIRGMLRNQGHPGLLALRSVIEGLTPAQRQVLREMIRRMASGSLPTQQERQLVRLIADTLQEMLKRCCAPAAGAGSQ